MRGARRHKPKRDRDFRRAATRRRPPRRADSNSQTADARDERESLTTRKIAVEVKVTSDRPIRFFQHRLHGGFCYVVY
jgi:hypothetical protein